MAARIAPILGEDGKPKEYLAQRFVIDEAKAKEDRLQEYVAQMQAQEEMMMQNVEALSAIQQEVSHREVELRQQQSQLRALIDNTPDTMLSIDRTYNITAFNEAMRHAIAGRGMDLHVGMNALSITAPHQQAVFKNYYDRAFTGERFSVEEHIANPEGEVHLLISYFPIQLAEEIIGAAVHAKDITGLKTLVS